MIWSVEEVRGSDREADMKENRERGTMRFLAAEQRGEKRDFKTENEIYQGQQQNRALQLALDSARFEFTLKMRLNRI